MNRLRRKLLVRVDAMIYTSRLCDIVNPAENNFAQLFSVAGPTPRLYRACRRGKATPLNRRGLIGAAAFDAAK
jgi:hypothetical protein